MYKAKNKLLPINIQTLFDSNVNVNYSLRNKKTFFTKHARINVKAMCVSMVGVKSWNLLDNKIKVAKSLNCFKKMYKNYIFHCYESQLNSDS